MQTPGLMHDTKWPPMSPSRTCEHVEEGGVAGGKKGDGQAGGQVAGDGAQQGCLNSRYCTASHGFPNAPKDGLCC